MKFPNMLLRAASAKTFLFINLIFAMYACSILVTAVRLTWDPSTYIWFRSLMEVQYRVTTGYLYSVGLFLTALVFLGISSVYPAAKRRLLAYFLGTLVLLISEAVYGIFMCVTLLDWWEHSQQAELIRAGLEVHQNVKPVMLFLEPFIPPIEDVNNIIHEVEQDAPKNVYLIVVTLLMSVVLQVIVLVVSWILQSNISAEVHKANLKMGPSIIWKRLMKVKFPERV